MQQPDSLNCRLARDLQRIEEFADALRCNHYSTKSVLDYRRCLIRTARSSRRSVADLQRRDVPMVTRRCFGRTTCTRRMARSALHAWLKFIGHFNRVDSSAPWQRWLDDYAVFLDADRGLASISRYQYVRVARRYLLWQFRRQAAVWDRVRGEDIWGYAAKLRRGSHAARTLNTELGILRQFLRFVHVRGGCSPRLAQFVPTFSERGGALRSETATEEERRRFLASFDRRTPEGRRDYAMAVCMLELGLRRIEVVRLRVGCIDLQQATLAVPAAKGGRGRVLPLPPHVEAALRDYLRIRPITDHDFLFVGIGTLAGRPVTSNTVSSAVWRACRRCGMQRRGTHRLRHCFATRLMRRGANIKEIADLLGHRHLKTTNVYTHATPDDLRPLVRPWPK